MASVGVVFGSAIWSPPGWGGYIVGMRIALLALLACQAPASSDQTAAPASDTGSTSSTTTSSSTFTVLGERLVLTSGEVVQGEVIATYDQSRWMWTPADETWLAVFDPAGWDGYPDDSSVRVVRESDVASRHGVLLPGPTWRDWLRTEGAVWEFPPLDGTSWVITGNDGYHLDEDGFGDFAWDLVATDAAGQRFTGAGMDNADFLVWGQPVYAARAGTVIEVIRDAPDHPPGAYPIDAVNNLVGIRVEGQVYQYYLHFRQGSIPPGITVGTEVSAGDLLGEVGNSGVTLEPHLHLTLLYWEDGEPGRERFWSVPSEWADLHVADQPTGSTLFPHAVPQTGQWIGPDAF